MPYSLSNPPKDLVKRIKKRHPKAGKKEIKQFIHVFLTGGEPTLDYRAFTLAENNSDMIFFMLTNGSAITQNYAKQLSLFGNSAM